MAESRRPAPLLNTASDRIRVAGPLQSRPTVGGGRIKVETRRGLSVRARAGYLASPAP